MELFWSGDETMGEHHHFSDHFHLMPLADYYGTPNTTFVSESHIDIRGDAEDS
jgi:hypothetical protein